MEQSLEVRRRVGYLPETVPLYKDMSIFDYLKFLGDIRQVEDIEDRIEEVLEMVNLEGRIDSFISSLSKGMRQRVGLAQALLHNPDVLILDEPTIGLDPAQIIEVRNLIRSLGKEHTVLLSTHILSEVQQLCDRILVINKGRIVAEDTPQKLAERFTGGQRIAVEVAGDGAGLRERLADIHSVQSVLTQDGGRVEFVSRGDADSRPEVAKALVAAGFDLLELRAVGKSLEEIFLELTTDDRELAEMRAPAPHVAAEDDDDDEMDEEE
jgi:ABC-2 type transport system ATP-binding protein